jgi:hypothetical protein
MEIEYENNKKAMNKGNTAVRSGSPLTALL